MEFSSIWYFSFWSLVSLIFSTTGTYALRRATIPVSDLFGYLITISICTSISYAFFYRPALEHDQELSAAHENVVLLTFHSTFGFVIHSIISIVSLTFLCHKCIGVSFLFLAVGTSGLVVVLVASGFKYYQAIGNLLTAVAGPLIMYPYHTLCWVIFQGFSLLFLCVDGYDGSWDKHLNLIFLLASIPSVCITFASWFKKPITASTMAAHAYEHRKIIEIIFGMLGTTLAQYYFRVKSVALMLGLLSWSIAWLGILANEQPSTDFGIFHFLVTASVECALSLFGLHFYTFLALCGGIVLMILRWKLEFVSLRHSGRKDIVMRDWKRLEDLYGIDSNDSSIRTYDPEQPSEGASDTQRLGI